MELSPRPGSSNGPAPARRPFPLGGLYVTPGVKGQVDGESLLQALRRHAEGDWGELCPEDKAANDAALAGGGRLFSSYRTKSGLKFWVITEADRSATTALLPEEY